MVPRQQVVDYISQNIRSGYDITSIRSRLIASGYAPAEVNAAIDLVESGKTRVPGHSNGNFFILLIIGIVGFLLVGGTALLFFKQAGDTPITSVNSNSNFNPPTKTTNPSTSKPSTTNKPSTTSTTTKDSTTDSDSTTNSGSSNIQDSTTNRDSIPTIDYGNSNSQSTLTTRLAIENKVNQLAASRPDEAASLCTQINTVAGQQSCLNNVAQASEESRFCTQISDVDAADTCLTSLALKQAEDANLCKLMKSEIRVRQCALLYDAQVQNDIVQKAAANVQTPALAKTPTLSDEQLVDAYSVDLDTIATQGSTSTTVETTQETVTQTTVTTGQTQTTSNEVIYQESS